MRNLILFVCLILAGCMRRQGEREKSYEEKRKLEFSEERTPEGYGSYYLPKCNSVHLSKIRDCDYVTMHDGGATHAGDCRNPIHGRTGD